MQLLFLFFLLLLSKNIFADTECPSFVASNEPDRRKNKNMLRLVQYNVEWLFIDYCDSANCPGSGCSWLNQTEAETHLTTVSNVIRDLQPDIINLCEVEGCDELKMVINKLDSTYVPYLKKGTDSSTGQNVGLLTRIDPLRSLYTTEERYNYPIAGSNCGYTGPISNTGVSKHYITEYNINGLQIAFISAHLLAFPTDSTRCAQREAQAMILQSVISNYTLKNYEIIFLGDLNDFDGENLDANNDKPLSHVLDIVKGKFGDSSGKYELYSVAETIVQKERYSDWWDHAPKDGIDNGGAEHSMLDHILISRGLRFVSAKVAHDYAPNIVSDHWPVVATLQFIDNEVEAEADQAKASNSVGSGSVVSSVAVALVVIAVCACVGRRIIAEKCESNPPRVSRIGKSVSANHRSRSRE